ncbi:MAG: M20 family metallopeptidase [Nitrospiraceae bacterium]|nr:M20 family metallopeptidase [Nitrospiraceae bacterium]
MPTDPNTRLETTLASVSPELLRISHSIHAEPELAFAEYKASELASDFLAAHGFSVKRGVAGMETAFSATTGAGDLHIAICAEYDALPDVGHACGHNIIASAALGAGALLAPLASELGVRVTVLGTPAEEGGGGKILMIEDGVFEDVDAAMMVHPAPAEFDRMATIAAQHIDVTYTGKEAHASAFPHLGINAMDSMTVAQVAIGLLRQTLLPDERVHGIVTHGGDAPNIIPAKVTARYIARADTLARLEKLIPRVRACFEAGAVATGASLEFTLPFPPYSELITDEVMAERWRAIAASRGREMIAADEAHLLRASTDMGNVSMSVPSIHPLLSIDSWPAVNHQPEFTAACVTEAADRAVLDGAYAMAALVVEMATESALRSRYANGAARKELRQKVAGGASNT